MYSAPSVSAAVSNFSKQIAEITKGIDTSAITAAAREAAVFQQSPALQIVSEQVKQFNDIMKPYQKAVDMLKPYIALQKSLGTITNIKQGNEDELDGQDNDIDKNLEDGGNNE